MNEVRQILTRASNLNFHMSADVTALAADGYRPQTVWLKMVGEESKKDSLRLVYDKEYVS